MKTKITPVHGMRDKKEQFPLPGCVYSCALRYVSIGYDRSSSTFLSLVMRMVSDVLKNCSCDVPVTMHWYETVSDGHLVNDDQDGMTRKFMDLDTLSSSRTD